MGWHRLDGQHGERLPVVAAVAIIARDVDIVTKRLAELDQQVSIYSLDRQLLAQWGNRDVRRNAPYSFGGCPHGIWRDSRGDLYVSEVQIDGKLHKYVKN